MFRVVLFALLAVASQAVPDGYILDVSHSCGTTANGGSITIKSDLHVKARLKCSNNTVVQMADIDETGFQSSTTLLYDGASSSPGDCIFSNPTTNSSLYTVELEVGWGFRNTSMMDELKTYTISCTTEGTGNNNLVGTIDDGFVPLEDQTDNIGGNFTGTTTVRLIDILGNEITGDLPMGKKMYLEIEVAGAVAGLTPYSCSASNGANSYQLLTAGCGDGSIIPRDTGFTTTGTSAKSPMFRAFRIATPAGNADSVTFTCSASTCASTCDGTSCALRQRRDASTGEPDLVVESRPYRMKISPAESVDAALRDLELETKLRLTEFEIMGVGVLAMVSMMIAVYVCFRSEKRIREDKDRKP